MEVQWMRLLSNARWKDIWRQCHQTLSGLQDIVSIETSGPYLLTIHLRQRSSLLLDDLEALLRSG